MRPYILENLITNTVVYVTILQNFLSVTEAVPVIEAPDFYEGKTAVLACFQKVVGENATLKLTISSDPNKELFVKKFFKKTASRIWESKITYTFKPKRNKKHKSVRIFKCTAKYSGGSYSTVHRLMVKVRPTLPVLVPVKPVSEGDITLIVCMSNFGDPAAELSWRYDSKHYTGKTVIEKNGDGTFNVTNTLNVSLSRPDNGKPVFCDMKHGGYDGVKSVSQRLRVMFPPVVSASALKYIANPNDMLTLQCKVDAEPVPYRVRWSKDGMHLNILSGHYRSGITFYQPTLTIYNTTQADEGKYRCIATNIKGTGSSQVITVLLRDDTLPSPTLTYLPYRSVIKSGFDVKLICSFQKKLDVTDVLWYRIRLKKTELIGLSHTEFNRTFGDHLVMTLPKVTKNSSGYYYCEIYNNVGIGQSRRVQITVGEKNVLFAMPKGGDVSAAAENVVWIMATLLAVSLGAGIYYAVKGYIKPGTGFGNRWTPVVIAGNT